MKEIIKEYIGPILCGIVIGLILCGIVIGLILGFGG